MYKYTTLNFAYKFKIIFLVLSSFFYNKINAQGIESVSFSSVVSDNNNFQPTVGAPYGVSISSASGSIEITAEYGESSFKETEFTSIENKDFKAKIKAFPNPASDFIIIEFTEDKILNASLVFIDLSGKELWDKKVVQDIEQIDLSPYPNGVYFLNVQNNNKLIQSFKIIKKNI